MKKLLLLALTISFIGIVSAQVNKWEGDVDNDWFNPDNWSLGIVPEEQDVLLPETSKANIVLSGGISTVRNVDINAGAGLIIMPDAGLKALGYVHNDGELIIYSDSDGYAGVFIDNGTISGTGNFSFFRDIGTTYPNYTDDRGWHYLGPPISPFGAADMLDLFLNLWDEPNDMWMHIEGTEPCVPADYTWTPLQGMSIKFDLGYNCPTPGTGGIIEFSGSFTNLHTGPISGNFTAEGTMAQHWNLMANPYPSNLLIPNMVFPPELNAAVYQWNGDNTTCVSYVGGVGYKYIAPTQGFFVSAISNGTLTLDNSMRAFYGQWLKDEIRDLLTLQASGNGYEDVTYIRFLNNATSSFDRDWDAYKFLSYVEGVPQIYSTSNDIKYSIQSRPAVSVVPVSFQSGKDGLYTIEVIEANDFSNVMLEDLLTGQEINILEESYTFTHASGNDPARFLVHFGTLGTIDKLADVTNIYARDKHIFVNLPINYNGEIMVFNLMGQEVARTGIVRGLNTLPVQNNNTYYLVQVVTEKETISRKVFVK